MVKSFMTPPDDAAGTARAGVGSDPKEVMRFHPFDRLRRAFRWNDEGGSARPIPVDAVAHLADRFALHLEAAQVRHRFAGGEADDRIVDRAAEQDREAV